MIGGTSGTGWKSRGPVKTLGLRPQRLILGQVRGHHVHRAGPFNNARSANRCGRRLRHLNGPVQVPSVMELCAVQHIIGVRFRVPPLIGVFSHDLGRSPRGADQQRALAAFRAHIVDLWRRTLRRRRQKDAST